MELKDILAIVGELTCANAALRQQVANLEAELAKLQAKLDDVPKLQ